MAHPRARVAWATLLALLATAPGCRPATREAADREAYAAIAARRRRVPQVEGSLRLEEAEASAAAARAGRRAGAGRSLTLAEALALGARASRTLRSEREDVVLAALALSDARHALRAIPFAGGGGEIAGDDAGATASAAGGAGVSRALESGGSLVLSVAQDFLRNLTGNPLTTAQSILSLDLLLPLARGSGRRVARENLTQAERDVVYALRSFARSQQRLTLDVASAYYRALAARDTWTNEERTFESLTRLEERQQALGAAGAGRIPDFQVAQARQDALRADDRRQRAEATYAGALDALALLLGLPVGTGMEPSEADLAALVARGPAPAPLGPADALARARDARLDWANAREQTDDARRKAEVARNGLGAQVDLALGADLTTPSTQPLNLKEASRRLSVGLTFDLPLDRTPERNAFRAALIQAVRALRALEALEDEADTALRQDLRRIEETRRSHAILSEGVRLAERRVESTSLLLEKGDVATRDVLEAQDDLVQAQNDLTRALVDHAVAWLTLEFDLGTLRVDGARTLAPPPPPPAPPPPPPPPATPPKPGVPPPEGAK